MTTAISILKQMPENKAQIETFVKALVEESLSFDNPLDVEVQLRILEEVIKKVRANEEYKENVIDFIYRNGEKNKIEKTNAKIEIVEAGTKYDFESCEDSIWNDLNNSFIKLSEEKKNRETFLKALVNNSNVVSEDTGEVIYPPVKTSKTTVKITLK